MSKIEGISSRGWSTALPPEDTMAPQSWAADGRTPTRQHSDHGRGGDWNGPVHQDTDNMWDHVHDDSRPAGGWRTLSPDSGVVERASFGVAAPSVTQPRRTMLSYNEGQAVDLDVASLFGNAESPLAYKYQVSGLPEGMKFDPSTGKITGTPAEGASKGGLGGIYKPGVHMLTVTEIDPQTGQAKSRNILIRVRPPVEASTDKMSADVSLEDATVGTLFSSSPEYGGTAPYRNATTTSALPQGLILNSNGSITGTPVASAATGGDGNGNYAIVVSLEDANGVRMTKTLKIRVKAQDTSDTD